MTGPRRLLEGEGTLLERELLLSARWEQPRVDGVERALSAVGLGVAAASTVAYVAAAGASAAATSATGSATLAGVAKGTFLALAMKWLAIGAVGGVFAAGAAEGHRLVSNTSPSAVVGASGPNRGRPSVRASRSSSSPGSVRTESGTATPPSEGVSPSSLAARPSSELGSETTGPVAAGAAVPRDRLPTDRVPAATTGIGVPRPSVPSGAAPPALGLAPQPEPPLVHSSSGSEPTLPPATDAPRGEGLPSSARIVAPVAANSLELAPEVAWMDRIRSELAQHRATEALSLLESYKRQFPRGRLVPEADLLRIRALLEEGDRAAAHESAAKLLRANPDGPYARQIRSLLDR